MCGGDAAARHYSVTVQANCPGGPSRCAIRMRRGGSGDMPRAMPYSSYGWKNKKMKKGREGCEIKMCKPQSSETERSWSLDTSWEEKKKQGANNSQADCMMP